MLGRIAMQRVHRARLIILLALRLVVNRLFDFLAVGALHPWRRARRWAVIRRCRRPMLLGSASRLDLRVGAARGAKRVGLADQPRELRQGIAFIPVVIAGKRPVLISISHRDDASPSGNANPLIPTNWPLPDALTNPRL